MAKNYEEDLHNLNIIGSGTDIIGNVSSNGDIRIDGKLEGNLTTKSKLVLGNTGLIIGDISCKNSEISGQITGKILVEEHLILKASAKIFGDIKTTKISIEPGAIFTGTCNMNGNTNTEHN